MSSDDRPLLLVVDDSAGTRLLTRETFEGIGFEVREASDGQACLEMLQSRTPELIILDVRMPGMDGFEVCRRVRQIPSCRDVPILMMTGLDDVESINRAYDAGATDFLTKPVNWTLLEHRVRYILRASRSFRDLRSKEERLVQAQEIARLGDFAYDVEHDRLECSEQLRQVFALPRQDVFSLEEFLAFVHADDRRFVREARLGNGEHGSSYDIRYRMIAGDGTERFVNEQARREPPKPGRSRKLVGAIQDISERKKIEERITYLAYRDSLTGLPNRRLFERRVRQAMDGTARLACIFLDLDGFKHINDSFGHNVGDELLQRVSERLGEAVGDGAGGADIREAEHGTVARFGGDEFIVLVRDVDRDAAADVAATVAASIAEPFPLGDTEILVTASLGIALYPDNGTTVDHLLKNADMAMYAAKQRGRNNFQFYSPGMAVDSSDRLSLASLLHRALERDEFELHYQPIYECASGRIARLEALVRWVHPKRGIIPPHQFIALAEETGIILPLGEWILRAACEDWQRWHGEGLSPPPLAINLSARQFQHADLTASVGAIFDAAGIEPHAVELEITEGALMDNSEASIRLLDQLKEMGVRLAIDDFGTGYSSLSYLKRFPLDCLKIDRSFITDLSPDGDDANIVSAIIAMAHNLQLEVVGEGVERPSQLEFLRAQGCDLAQGFLLARPAPAGSIRDLLSRDARGPAILRARA